MNRVADASKKIAFGRYFSLKIQCIGSSCIAYIFLQSITTDRVSHEKDFNFDSTFLSSPRAKRKNYTAWYRNTMTVKSSCWGADPT